MAESSDFEEKLEFDISSFIRLPLKELQKFVNGERVLQDIQSDLSFPLLKQNPRKDSFPLAPQTIQCWYLRKQKTDPTLEIPPGSLENFVRILKKYKIPFKANDFLVRKDVFFKFDLELRDYQKEAVFDCMKRHRGVLVAPCGSGKTVMGIKLASLRSQKTLVLVHTLDLLRQWQSQIKSLCGIESGVISSKECQTDSFFVIATVQSLIRNRTLMLRLSEEFGTILVDECHHTPASTFTKILACFRPLNLYGLSATPQREDGLSPVMYAWIGKALHKIDQKKLQNLCHLMKPILKTIPTEFFYDFQSENEDYSKLMDSLIKDAKRNSLIQNSLVQTSGRFNLILSSRIEHCEILYQNLCMMIGNEACEILTSQTKKTRREEIILRAREGKIRYLFATQLADEGLDIPCLDALWLVCPSRNAGRIEQRIGRIMRTQDGKNTPVVHDFVDELTGVLHSQFKTRFFQVYRKICSV